MIFKTLLIFIIFFAGCELKYQPVFKKQQSLTKPANNYGNYNNTNLSVSLVEQFSQSNFQRNSTVVLSNTNYYSVVNIYDSRCNLHTDGNDLWNSTLD